MPRGRKKKELQRATVEQIQNDPYLKRLFPDQARYDKMINGVKEEQVAGLMAEINIPITDDDGKEKKVAKPFILLAARVFEGTADLCKDAKEMLRHFNYGASLDFRRRIKGYIESDSEDVGTFLNNQVTYMVDKLSVSREIAVEFVKNSEAYKAKLAAREKAEKEKEEAESMPDVSDGDDGDDGDDAADDSDDNDDE